MKKKISLVINILIVVLEIIGLIAIYKYNDGIQYEYYTEDSNILALISSILVVIYMLGNEKIPKWLSSLKYMSTICLSLTFFVVIFILVPMADFNYKYYLFQGALLYQHLLCPLLAIITFIFFDDLDTYTMKDSFYGLTFTIIYSIVLVVLNALQVVIGPYPFLMVLDQSLLASIIWGICLLGFAYFLAYILRKLYILARNK